MSKKPSQSEYWKTATRITLSLLVVWFVVSYGFGILLVEPLNELHLFGQPIQLFGFPIGFWFAHQGSIFVFIVLILVYCILMDRLDRAATKSEGSS